MIIGIRANFDSVDLAEMCANKVRKNVSGSKSIKIISIIKKFQRPIRYLQEVKIGYPHRYRF